MQNKVSNQLVSISNDYIDKQKDFEEDVLSCFLNKENSMLMPYLHDTPRYEGDKVHSAELWNDYYHDKAYYLPRYEIDVIESHAEAVSEIIGRNKMFIDIGPGCLDAVRDKVLPLMKKAKQPKGYGAIDLCKEYIDVSTSFIKNNVHDINTLQLHQNFYKPFSDKISSNSNVGIFFGCTVGNIAENNNSWIPYHTIRNLASIRESIGKDGYLILTQDTNQNSDKLHAAYSCSTARIYNLNVMERIKRDLNPKGYNPSLFKYTGEWDRKNLFYAGYAEATERQSFIYSNSIPVAIEKGQKVCLYRSYKYGKDDFIQIGKAAGYTPISVFFDKTNTLALHLWRT